MGSRPLLVLFISTGNAARSQIAEVLLNAKQSEYYRARSAGMDPIGKIDPDTKALLELAGYDTLKLHPKGWEDFYAAQHLVPVDIIVTLSEEARLGLPPEWPGDPVRVHWTLDDPLGAERADVREWKFRKCFATLEARISTLVRSRPALNAGQMFMRLKDIGMVV